MKIGFIGLGNMAKAIIAGMVQADLVNPSCIYGNAKSEATKKTCEESYQMNILSSNIEVAKTCDIIILAVKPQYLSGVCEEIKEYITTDKLCISLAAGKSISWLQEALGDQARMIRMMPNTPALIGESCTAICVGETCTKEDEIVAVKIAESFGLARIIDENLMNPFIGVSGSSVAYAFLYLEALADGAVAMGMPRKEAYEFAAQSTLGAAKLMLESKKHPGELKDMVCSPGGTTIAAVKSLENGGFRGAIMDAVEACVKRAEEL